MALSVRVFGLSSWSILVPQALMGSPPSALVFSSVRRYFSAQAAAHRGGGTCAHACRGADVPLQQPRRAARSFLTGAVVATLRAIENGRTRWMVLAGLLVGLGFLTKQLQASSCCQGSPRVYLIAAPSRCGGASATA